MQSKSFKFGETVFRFESEMELFDSKSLLPFSTDAYEPGYRFQVRWAKEGEETPDGYGHIRMEREGENISLSLNTEKGLLPSTEQLMMYLPVISLLLEKDTLILHASYVLSQGKAILFCGPSQIGKSTQAGLWEKYRNAEVVNGDRTLLFLKDGKVYAGGFFQSGTSGICKNRTAPVAAIVLLGQGMENRVSPVGGVSAFRRLIVQSAYDVQNRKEVEMATAIVAKIISHTKVLGFVCRKDETAVGELEQYI